MNLKVILCLKTIDKQVTYYAINLQEKRLVQEISDIEKDTGFKLRVLAQNYPETPGILFISCALQMCFQHYIPLILKELCWVNTPFIFPGLAIRDFWQVDDRTIVFVADPTFGKITGSF